MFNLNLDMPPPPRKISEIFRKSKRNPPEIFSGSKDDAYIRNWILRVIKHMALSTMVGLNCDMDRYQVMFISLLFSGEALIWYSQFVEQHGSEHYGIGSLNLLCEFYLRFIPRSAALRAMEKFNSIQYKEAGGVQDLYPRMRSLAIQMPEPPSSYEFRRRFLEALPTELKQQLMLTSHHSAEHSSMDIIYQDAQVVEDSLRSFQNLEKSNRHNSSTSRPNSSNHNATQSLRTPYNSYSRRQDD